MIFHGGDFTFNTVHINHLLNILYIPLMLLSSDLILSSNFGRFLEIMETYHVKKTMYDLKQLVKISFIVVSYG